MHRELSCHGAPMLFGSVLALSLAAADPSEVAQLHPRVIATRPHAADAFTQGLLWHDGVLYESTGRYAESSIRKTDPDTGKVLARVDLPTDLFAEGMARVGDRLWILTWHENTALVYDLDDLRELRRVSYQGEGWGLCHDGDALVMSDGSSTLQIRHPRSFEPQSTVRVTRKGRPVKGLNELECVGDHVYANVWPTDEIVVIQRDSGTVTAVIDGSALAERMRAEHPHVDVLNGIAYHPQTGHLLVTGKWWPVLFEIDVEQPPRQRSRNSCSCAGQGDKRPGTITPAVMLLLVGLRRGRSRDRRRPQPASGAPMSIQS